MTNTNNLHIKTITPLITPDAAIKKLPITEEKAQFVAQSRQHIQNIQHKQDNKILAIVGPCSAHNPAEAMDYAKKLKTLADELNDSLFIVMRVYFEKPRTTVGWKGLINDPHLDNSYAINEGLLIARQLLLDINALGLPVATEFVDTITPQYIADLVSWAAIGARTSESQPHRMLASGLSMPVGFKNNTSGDISAAINAVLAAAQPHRFLGITSSGLGAIVETEGNPNCHVILRGGKNGPNYDSNTIQTTLDILNQQQLPAKIIIDCSHDNCFKDYTKQHLVIEHICQTLQQQNHGIMGLMLESNLVAGKQNLIPGQSLNYGQSITDGCVDWDETVALLKQVAKANQRGHQHD